MLLGGAVLAAVLAAAAPAHAGQAVVSVTQTGESSFRVPAGVTSLSVRALGAPGSASGGGAGRGAAVAGTVAVTPQTVLTVLVGASGGAAGAAGGAVRGGNGGGGSGLYAATDALLVAGGGGGGGGGPHGGAGGDAGAAGAAGHSPGGNSGGGEPGTASSGGAGGVSAAGGGTAGQSGAPRTGGVGGAGSSGGGSGGGGGGGYFGGGGGGGIDAPENGAGGGGGGSNFTTGATNVTVTPSTAAPSVQLTYTDDQAPVVTLDQPAALNPQTVSGIAGLDGGDAASVTLEFYAGDTVAGSPAATISAGKAADGAFTAAVPRVGDGTWTVRAVQGDAGGNFGTSQARTFVFDFSGPNVLLTGPDPVTGDAVPHFEGVIGTAPGDLPAVTLTVTRAGGNATTFPADGVKGGSFSADAPAPLADGAYTVVASQVDELGHVGTSSRTFVVDTAAPAVTLTGPDVEVTGATITGTAGEATGDGDTVLLELRSGNRVVSTLSAGVDGGAFAATVPLADGDYTVTATQTDHAGNAGAAQRTFRVATPVTMPGVTPAPAPAPVTPQSAVKKAAAGLKIKSATASRRGRTITLKLRGTAAKTATGTVKVTVAGTRKSAKLVKGAWAVTLRITAKRKASLKVTAAYGGDGGFSAATARRTVRV